MKFYLFLPFLLITIITCKTSEKAQQSNALQVQIETEKPLALMLSWHRDPLTTMNVQWHTDGDSVAQSLSYKLKGTTAWRTISSQVVSFPNTKRFVHKVFLEELKPGTRYEFKIKDNGYVYEFETMPKALSRTIKIASGGDTRHQKDWMMEVSKKVQLEAPDFVLLGGDLAYADGKLENFERWFEWFDVMTATMIDSTNRVIPIVAGLGNHEVRHRYIDENSGYEKDQTWRVERAPFFYTFFDFPVNQSYDVLDFGSYLSLIALDTQHLNPIEGEQTMWLERVISERKEVPHLIPFYHVPAWPSVRKFDGLNSERIREHWLPLFEASQIKVAFENHDHAYKRTKPMAKNGIDADNGITYIGDGAWGVGVRELRLEESGSLPWYMERAESVRHFILMEIEGKTQRFKTIDQNGDVIDRFQQTVK